nr:MFS transporter [Bacillus subtilis]
MLASSFFFIPQALASSLSVLLVFRFLFGMAMGGLLPCITAAIRVQAPGSIQGEVLGYNVSFRFLGNVLEPLLGGIISSHFTISVPFTSRRFSFSPAPACFGSCRNFGKILITKQADSEKKLRNLLNLTFS